MKTTLTVLLALAIFGCSEPRPERAALRAETFDFEDPLEAHTSARVFRAVGADGTEVLHGETEFGSRRVIEDATLDPAGHLLRAEVRIAHCTGATEDHVI